MPLRSSRNGGNTSQRDLREKNEDHAQGRVLKITRIRVREVAIPLLKSYTISRVGTLTETGSVVLEMDTDQGLTGVGESDPALMFTGESQHTVVVMWDNGRGNITAA